VLFSNCLAALFPRRALFAHLVKPAVTPEFHFFSESDYYIRIIREQFRARPHEISLRMTTSDIENIASAFLQQQV
jgi:hypothetical protein